MFDNAYFQNLTATVSFEEKQENKKKWITFYRRNIHRLITDYFNINIYPHQQLEFYLMGQSTRYAEVCSRGLAKSWKAGLFSCSWAVLYPNSEIVIVSESKKQAGIIIDKKIRPLYDKYENLHNEIKNIVNNNNDMKIEFWNGSVIFVVPLRETARGNRASLIIYEEFRRLDKHKLDSIISPFKHPRQTEYMKKPEYSHLVEEAKEIFITSSGRESEEWYDTIKKILKQSFQGRKSMCIFADYILGIMYNMQTKQQIREERQKMGEETFSIEYENMCIRDNSEGFFTRSVVESCRVLKVGYYPQHSLRYDPKKNALAIPKKENELICEWVDIALKEGKGNDNAIIHIDRLIPTKKGYKHSVVYTEPMNGRNTLDVALRIKQLWYDFSVNYILLDTNGNGIGVYDVMTEVTRDDSRGLEYPAMMTMKHPTISKYEDYKQRTRAIDALPIIYPMWAGEAINSEMAFLTRDLMRSDMVEFMCTPAEGEEFLTDKAKYFDVKKDMSMISWFMRPYYQASELQGELLALIPIYSGNMVKLVESKGGRKDRYVAFAYGCWFTKNVLDPLIVREIKEVNYEDMVIVSAPNSQAQTANTNKYFGGKSRQSNNNGRKLFGR